MLGIAAALILTGGATTALLAQAQNQGQEVKMGQEVFNELKAKGEIMESSPPYDQSSVCGRHYSGGTCAILALSKCWNRHTNPHGLYPVAEHTSEPVMSAGDSTSRE